MDPSEVIGKVSRAAGQGRRKVVGQGRVTEPRSIRRSYQGTGLVDSEGSVCNGTSERELGNRVRQSSSSVGPRRGRVCHGPVDRGSSVSV